MVAAPDHDRCRSVLDGALARQIERLDHQPRAGQPAAVPGDRGAGIGHGFRIAVRRHGPGIDFLQVTRQQLKAVGGVTEQIAFHQDLRDGPGSGRRQAGA